MKIVFLLFSFLFFGCSSGRNVFFSDAVFPFVNKEVHQVGKRLVYLHGIDGTHIDLVNFKEYKTVIDILTDAGWQVITIDIPKVDEHMFDDGGVSYRKKYKAKLIQTIEWSEKNVGHADVNIIGGISWGGLHSLVGAAINDSFVGYFADIPVTIPETLGHGFKPSPSFNPFNEENLVNKTGFFDYGELDTATNWKLTVQLINKMNKSMVTYEDFPKMGHEVHDLTKIAEWVLRSF